MDNKHSRIRWPFGYSQQRCSDRSDWPSGPWDNEPDWIRWMGFEVRCEIVRNLAGAWLGYIYLPPSHPWHGREHGQFLTLSDGRPLTASGRELDAKGKPTGDWALGFDCNQPGDAAPCGVPLPFRQQVYRDQEYARRMVEELALLATGVEGKEVEVEGYETLDPTDSPKLTGFEGLDRNSAY